ncbi:MAG: hypothetical protein EB100_07715, partial [Crocinitomicaceae bacterium]|nr:hypothetical protein [Crocinitomicaceae bacterium]
MSKKQKTSGGFTSLAASIAVAISLILGIVIYKFIFGDPGNFVDGDPTAEPLEGNFMGIIYKGGIIVPVLVAMNLIVLIFSIERFITLSKAKGKGRTDKFVEDILTSKNKPYVSSSGKFVFNLEGVCERIKTIALSCLWSVPKTSPSYAPAWI